MQKSELTIMRRWLISAAVNGQRTVTDLPPRTRGVMLAWLWAESLGTQRVRLTELRST